MSLRDLLDAGITFCGAINVRLYRDGEYEDGIFLPGDRDPEIRMLPKKWMDLEIKYIYPRMRYNNEINPHVVIELEDE